MKFASLQARRAADNSNLDEIKCVSDVALVFDIMKDDCFEVGNFHGLAPA